MSIRASDHIGPQFQFGEDERCGLNVSEGPGNGPGKVHWAIADNGLWKVTLGDLHPRCRRGGHDDFRFWGVRLDLVNDPRQEIDFADAHRVKPNAWSSGLGKFGNGSPKLFRPPFAILAVSPRFPD